MRYFGYPYNDLVICKDSPDYLALYYKCKQILSENGIFHISKPISRSFELFPQHSCQVVYHRPPKLPETGNTFSRSFFSKKVVRPL